MSKHKTELVGGCVDCGLPCIGSSCPHSQPKLTYLCDCCGEEAVFDDGTSFLCCNCTESKLDDRFESLDIWQKAQILGVDLSPVYREVCQA